MAEAAVAKTNLYEWKQKIGEYLNEHTQHSQLPTFRFLLIVLNCRKFYSTLYLYTADSVVDVQNFDKNNKKSNNNSSTRKRHAEQYSTTWIVWINFQLCWDMKMLCACIALPKLFMFKIRIIFRVLTIESQKLIPFIR